MQIWQLFIVLRQPVTILATVFYNPIKLMNDLYFFRCVTLTWCRSEVINDFKF